MKRTHGQYHSEAPGNNRTIRIARHEVEQALEGTRILSGEAEAFADRSGAAFDICGAFVSLIYLISNLNNVFQVVLARLLDRDVYCLG